LKLDTTTCVPAVEDMCNGD